jgi:glucosamine 6-phosphate synthetase-like amidotransferase/phosphosugar isomerase protein
MKSRLQTILAFVLMLVCVSPLAHSQTARLPSPGSKMEMSMNMSEMMKDKDMMRQMCAQMAKDPAMAKMMCDEMMKNPQAMKTMCNEMMKNPEMKKMCMAMMK